MNELPTHDAFRSQIQKIFTVVYDKNRPPEILTLQSVSDISAIGGGFGGYGMTFSAPLGKNTSYRNNGLCTMMCWAIFAYS